jgi:signal transduction histidine kinase
MDALSAPVRRALARAGSDIRSPLDAVTRLADEIRAGSGAERREITARAESILAAAWRLMRVAADLEVAAASGASGPVLCPSEVDIARLARRVAALAAPAAASAGVALATAGLPPAGAGPVVLTDEGALWSACDQLVRHAVRLGAKGSQVAVSVSTEAGGAALAVSLQSVASGDGPATSGNGDLDDCRDLALAIGASLEIGVGPAFSARLLFPAARCLGQP